jgi:hypothetical protein
VRYAFGFVRIRTDSCPTVRYGTVRTERNETKKTRANARQHTSVGSVATEGVGIFISQYVKAYQRRYTQKARPVLSGKVQGQIKRFVAEHPLERACELIQVYLQMPDPWFETKAHDFTTFLENLNKVGLALDTGKQNGTRRGIEEILGEAQNELPRIQSSVG